MTTPDRKRRHPARRSRLSTGVLSLAAVAGLTGYLSLDHPATSHVTTATNATAVAANDDTSTTIAPSSATSATATARGATASSAIASTTSTSTTVAASHTSSHGS